MEEAFKRLKDLTEDDMKDPAVKEKEEAFQKAMEKFDLSVLKTPEMPVEAEAELFKDMAEEVSEGTSVDLEESIKKELGGKADIPVFDGSQENRENFMEKAFEDALKEVAERSDGSINKEKLLDDKKIMKGVEKIFDEANEQLLGELEVIRKEQVGQNCTFCMQTPHFLPFPFNTDPTCTRECREELSKEADSQ